MKRIIVVLIFSILMIVAVSVSSFGEETKGVTVFDITLGKSLTEAGVPKCKSINSKNSDCYTVFAAGSNNCSLFIKKSLSFPVVITVNSVGKCDPQLPVELIETSFYVDYYTKMMQLATDKFGKPTMTKESYFKNRKGAIITKLETFWNLKKCSIYLSNTGAYPDDNKGMLKITYIDKLLRDAEESRKRDKADKDKF